MFLHAIVVAVVSLVLINHSMCAPSDGYRESPVLTTYDQKQTGKYNIHLNIKDVAIIAVESEGIGGGIGDFGEDYYDYDISDFTIKPIIGLIGDIPPVNSTPSIFHSEPTESFELANVTNTTDIQSEEPNVVVISTTVSTEKSSEKPIISGNKTQNVVILSDQSASTTPASSGSVTILSYNTTADNDTGIVVTTKTPTAEELPPKIPLNQASNATKIIVPPGPTQNLTVSLQNQILSEQKVTASKASYDLLVQTEKQHHHPSEIPVSIIMEPLITPATRHNLRNKLNRPAQQQYQQQQQHVRQRVKATPTAIGVRRITPPHNENVDNIAVPLALTQSNFRRNAHVNSNHRGCAKDLSGRCQTNRSGM